MVVSPVMTSFVPVIVRGQVPASMQLPASRGGVNVSLRGRIANAVRAFEMRHGVMPEEVEIDGAVFGVAGVCSRGDCGNVVLASDAGAVACACDDCI